MRISILTGGVLAALALPALAQQSGNTILVLDGSGSMWGQIDGKAKITIAQEVVGELLPALPQDQALGLTLYGHRRKGDCSDIETVVAPGTGTQGAISEAVNAVKPKGKTPMTDAVRQAAEALRYTEEKATVILVSDGIETCNPDPCAAARALEEAGVDFTAHVIGFDISDPDALAQMQCLAGETGGSFRSASNAAELGAALAVVAEPVPEPEPEPEPAPSPVKVTFTATDGAGGPVIGAGLIWSLFSGNDALTEGAEGGAYSQELLPGSYRVEVLRLVDEATASAEFEMQNRPQLVELVLPDYAPPATLEAPESAVAGSAVPVRWTGPDGQQDYIQVGPPGSADYIHYAYTAQGAELALRMPPQPGQYEIRYILNDGRKSLASRKIEVTPVEASVAPPATGGAGGTISIDWTGPDYPNDYIAVSRPGEDGYLFYAYTNRGSPAEIPLPSEPGAYEARYIMENGTTILASATFEVTASGATLTPPEVMQAGSTVDVIWTGPDNQNDYIGITERGAEDGYLFYAYTRNGSPAKLALPATPGDYDLVYFMGVDRSIIGRVPVTVTGAEATLEAPAALPAGATVEIAWTGPNNQRDFIAIRQVGDEGGYLQYAYTSRGNPAALQMPADGGDYELVYYLDIDRRAIATVPVTVSTVAASVLAPDEVSAASQVLIEWTGPNYDRDYVAVTERGEEAGYITYAYTRHGSPVPLMMPETPGEYDVVYIMAGENKVIARQPISVR